MSRTRTYFNTIFTLSLITAGAASASTVERIVLQRGEEKKIIPPTEFSGITVGSASYDGGVHGGAIENHGKVTISNGSSFIGNKADTANMKVNSYGGAIFNDGIMIIGDDVVFDNNIASNGGAILNEETATSLVIGDNVQFLNTNKTAVEKEPSAYDSITKFKSGGAILAKSDVEIGDNVLFRGNTSNWGGAAIALQKGADVIIGKNAQFIQNSIYKAAENDAIVDFDEDNPTTLVVDAGSIFNDNKGVSVGVRNAESTATLTSATFRDNIGYGDAGAIFNIGTVNLVGTTVFENNRVNSVLNDIHNNGTLNVSGHLTLDGGITGTGSIIFDNDTTLHAKLNTTTILANSVTFGKNNTLHLIIDNTMLDGNYSFITTQTLTGIENVSIAENALYNLSLTSLGEIALSKKETSTPEEEFIKAGVDPQIASALTAITSSSSNPIFNSISELIQTGDVKGAAKLAEEVAPTTSQTVMGVAQGVNSVLSNVAGTRMAAVGRNGGDAFVGGAMWVQGLLNHTKQDSTSNNSGFSSDTNGISFGIDGKVNENLMIGIGYGYTNTDADSGNRNIDVDGHNFFAYTEYKPNKWYINGMFNYGFSKYDEQKIAGLQAKYDVNTYAANVMTGYDFDSGITPEVGLRYLLADQDSYNDGAQYISTDKTDVLTGVIGIKYKADVKAKDWAFTPNLHLAATYDMMSDKSKANVNVIGGGSYQITGDHLERFGFETGVGIETTYKDWNLLLDYNGGFRKDFQSHTGMLKAKYNF